MIEFRQVTKRYDSDHTALRQVNFSLARGEMAFLTGHSGAGKSTLLKLIMVMERPSAGEVVVGGQVLNTLPRRQIPYIRRLSVWCSRITSCCSIARCLTTSPCRWK